MIAFYAFSSKVRFESSVGTLEAAFNSTIYSNSIVSEQSGGVYHNADGTGDVVDLHISNLDRSQGKLDVTEDAIIKLATSECVNVGSSNTGIPVSVTNSYKDSTQSKANSLDIEPNIECTEFVAQKAQDHITSSHTAQDIIGKPNTDIKRRPATAAG